MLRVKTMGLFLTAAMLLGACCFDGDTRVDAFTVDKTVTELHVDVGSGDIDVSGSDGKETVVTAAITGTHTDLDRHYGDGTLRLTEDCNDWDPCAVDVAIGVPDAAVLRLHTGSGDVSFTGIAGAVTVETGSGDVSASGLTSHRVQIKTGSGDVRALFDEPPDKIVIDTGSGDVRLRVPEESYGVRLDTGSGDEFVDGIDVDSDAPRSIRVDTGSGDVRVSGS
jgi:ferric-dicitrate binding protein FerR (iron transport regulator)